MGNHRTTIYDSRDIAAAIDPLGCRSSFSYDLAPAGTDHDHDPMGRITAGVYDQPAERSLQSIRWATAARRSMTSRVKRQLPLTPRQPPHHDLRRLGASSLP